MKMEQQGKGGALINIIFRVIYGHHIYVINWYLYKNYSLQLIFITNLYN